MRRVWRLLPLTEGTGAWNMGVDEALLASAVAGVPTLRFYRWGRACLSLGYGQRLRPERLAACRETGLPVVRRATGGGAVLHGEDLTYAVAAPAAELPPGLPASYALIAEALVAALSGLGVAARLREEGSEPPGPSPFDCFAETAAHEICAGGRKLVGSAQRRHAGAVLQHGSIRLSHDSAAARRAAGLDAEASTSLGQLGSGAGADRVADACRAALAEALSARFLAGSLTPEERRIAAARREDRVSALTGTPPMPPLPAGTASRVLRSGR